MKTHSIEVLLQKGIVQGPLYGVHQRKIKQATNTNEPLAKVIELWW